MEYSKANYCKNKLLQGHVIDVQKRHTGHSRTMWNVSEFTTLC